MLCGVSGPGAAGAISPSRGFNGQPGRELSRGWRCALLSWLDKRLVVALDPVNNVHAYFYVAGTYFGLHRLPAAEKNARMAAELDKKQHEPRTHFLLAQIYEMQHKPDAEAAQLREYLKSATDPQDVAMVKKYLADLRENPRK